MVMPYVSIFYCIFIFYIIFWVCIVYEFVIFFVSVCISNAYIITMGNQLDEH